jgi:hypothetical protein
VKLRDEAPNVVHTQVGERRFARTAEKRCDVTPVGLRGAHTQSALVRQVPNVLFQQAIGCRDRAGCGVSAIF